MEWTADQLNAATLLGHRMLVSAAAGSGKTAVLTERIMRRISDPDDIDIDQMLVMTFTRAAASEMRERIRAKLEERIAAAAVSGDSRECEKLRRQSALIDGAKITTIDSFCLSVLRENADKTDLDPAFRVGGEDELALLKEDILAELMESRFEEADPSFLRFAEGYSGKKDDDGLQDMVRTVYEFAESMPRPVRWLKEQLKQAETFSAEEEDVDREKWAAYIFREIHQAAAECVLMAEEAEELCCLPDGPGKVLDSIRGEKEALEKLKEAESFSKTRKVLSCFPAFETLRYKVKGADPLLAERVKTLRDGWKGVIRELAEDYASLSEEEIREELQLEAETVKTVVSLALSFKEAYSERKRERNILDFSDIEHEALAILTEETEDGSFVPTETAENYAAAFTEIYVDEYQDSNEVQEELLRAIGRDELFLVGDIKQSIYGFRQARPGIFGGKLKTFRKYKGQESVEEAGESGIRIDLSSNFRSRSEVIDSVNRLFERIMQPDLGGVAYDEAAMLRRGAEFPEIPSEEKESDITELLLSETGQDDPDAEEELEADEAEARTIAKRILELTDPETGLLIADRKNGGLRRAEFGDIAVLLRSLKGRAEVLVNILLEAGIPAEADQTVGYFDAMEVKTVLSVLQAVDNPMQDIPLAAFLRAPFAGLTEEELAVLLAEEEAKRRAETEALEKGDAAEPDADDAPPIQYATQPIFYDRIRSVMKDAAPETAEKLVRAFSYLEEAAKKAVYLPLSGFIRWLLDGSGYYTYVSALPGGQIRCANLDMLCEKAAAFEASGSRGLADFVRYIGLLKKYERDTGEASQAGGTGGRVRIMSIHKSKGLQFPIVFAAGLQHRFNKRDLMAQILAEPEMGLAASCIEPEQYLRGSTMKKKAFASVKLAEMLGEELRVLYVAATRAEEKLIFSAAPGKLSDLLDRLEPGADLSESGEAEIVSYTRRKKALCFLDWIVQAVRVDPAGLLMTVRAEGAVSASEEAMKKKAAIVMLSGEIEDLLTEKADDAAKAARYPMELPYPEAEAVNLHTKLSVSEIKHREMEALAEEEGEAGVRPAYVKNAKGEGQEPNSGAKRGTVFHKIMEKLDYEKTADEEGLIAFLRELAADGTFTEEEAKLIDAGKIRAFLASELGARMKAAALQNRLHREMQFVMALPASEVYSGCSSRESVVIQGIIDAWFTEGENIILVDYKTDHVRDAKTLSDRYKGQLSCYAKALSMMQGREVSEKLIWSDALHQTINL